MAYKSTGKLPIERASKIGHMRVIQEPHVQRLIEAFESTEAHGEQAAGELSGHIDLDDVGEMENIVAIDGSECAIPNVVRAYKRVAFVTAGVVILKRSEIAAMAATPIVDPRELATRLRDSSRVFPAMIPLAGVVLPNETVVDTIRRTIDDVLRYTGLYGTLRFLISREWITSYDMVEHMECRACEEEFPLPRSTLNFRCPACGTVHTLADYLGIVKGPPEDWAREEVASSLMSVMETLILMNLVRLYYRKLVLRRTMFVKDGPLLLRAQLSRLVEPIRAFLKFIHESGQDVFLVGVEKSGDLVDHIPLIGNVLSRPGDYFLPSVRYLKEEIQGTAFVPSDYRNRVQYGSKVVVRLGSDHVVALNVPTGDFLVEPGIDNLYGFRRSVSVLSGLVSYAHENALLPLVVVNNAVSLSLSPSSDVLEVFARRLLRD